ncbi:hotdog fold thioesterase [Pseudarthrobacter sp. J64]|uniref:hotdog fold thioesterase n=1 Tax=Pseudarthrobacter sp. J64 TaxID=3116485 RepID=UPI002E7FCEB4|nr:hotdog fold thioesterase [Pseudarthrobacter sp. J64]MEE2567905.1 hotdog fold thioesterase [Pseudarthrobacter sp. J64]
MVETTLSGVAHPILEKDHASAWLGIQVLHLRPGHATIRMTLRQEMLNGFGIAHGGMIFAVADTAFALACNPVDSVDPQNGEPASITVAAGVDINFLKPAREGQIITAVAGLRSQSGRSGIYDIQVFASDADPSSAADADSPTLPPAPGELPGELIAEFRGRSRTIPKK